jgi:hypothetical protein
MGQLLLPLFFEQRPARVYACGQGACRSEPLSDVVRVGDVKSNSCQYSAIEAADWALSTIKKQGDSSALQVH